MKGILLTHELVTFLKNEKEWDVTDKVTTIGTNSAQNMVATTRSLPRVVHIIQKAIAVPVCDSRFVSALATCHKILWDFKHSPANTAELKLQVSHGQEEESLIYDVPTHWYSSLQMIMQVQHNKDLMMAMLAQQKNNLAMLSLAEYN